MLTFEEVREEVRRTLGRDDEVLARKCFAAMEKFMKENPNPSALDAVVYGAFEGARAALEEEDS